MQATIHNEFLTLTVDTLGAEAVSLKNAAGEELLWQADPAVWKRHAPILFPWTGKLPGGTFTHGGKTYKGGQHGFARIWSTPCSAPRATPLSWNCARTMRSRPSASPSILSSLAPSGWRGRPSTTP